MNRAFRVVIAAAVVTGLSCAKSSSTPKTAPTPSGTGAAAAPARAPAAAPPAAAQPPAAPPASAGAPPAGIPGGPPGGGRGGRVPLTPEQRQARRDSINAADAIVVQKLLTQIAGKENLKSQDVWQNLELLQDTTAGRLVKLMDEYSRAVGRGCEFCHTVDKWAEDTRKEKKTTRQMIEMTNVINFQQLSKLPAGREGTPKISCMTCHRGANDPPPANRIIP
jgi:pyruvate/2-oxoglutarate dehydrogenase complex dihydrolipoamide acyltransferase (E2) component